MSDNFDNSNNDDRTAPVDEDDREEEEEEAEEEDGAPDQEGAAAGAEAAGGSTEPVLSINAVSNLDSLYGLREIGREALCWQLSSAKPGNGVEQIRDQSTDTYWQSDGTAQPHWIQVHFARRVAISHVCLYLDYNLDESYTPKHLNVQVGMTTQDLVPAIYPVNTLIELNDPVGWCIIPLTAPPDPLDDEEDEEEEDNEDDDEDNDEQKSKRKHRLVRTHLIQISVISMHQNGRDTHIRQVQLYGPRTISMHPGGGTASFAHAADAPTAGEDAAMVVHSSDDWQRQRSLRQDFATTAMSQFSVIR
jgi:anaphase-promoting complex subunit 10